MSDDTELAERALQQLRGTIVPVEDTAAVDRRRPRLVSTLKKSIQEAPVARRRRKLALHALGAAAALAVGVLLAIGTFHLVTGEGGTEPPGELAIAAQECGAQLRKWSGHVVVGPPGQELDLHSSTEPTLEEATFLSTHESGWVEFELPGDVSVEVAARTRLQVLAAEPKSRHVRLMRGRVDLQVPRATNGSSSRLLVSTPDAEVEVRGTVFSVEVLPSRYDPARLVTDVFVLRGKVAVRHAGREDEVLSGTRWSSDRDDRAQASPQGAEAVPTADESPPEDERGGDSRRLAKRSETPSTLAEQNLLFERALEARDRGAWREVVHSCDELLTRYPSSVLAEYARAERARAVEKLQTSSPPGRLR